MATTVDLKRKADFFCLDDTLEQLPAKRQRTEESAKVASVVQDLIPSNSSNNSQSVPSLSDRVSLLDERAEACMGEGNFDEAIKLYAAIATLIQGDDSVAQARVCFNWAVALHERDAEGDLETEIEILKIGLSARLEHEDIDFAAELLDNLGDAYLSLKDYPKALAVYSRGVELLKKTPGRLLVRMFNGRGLACERMGKIQEAVKNYREALAIKHDDTLLKIVLVHNYCSHSTFIPLSEGIGLVYGALTLPIENTPQEESSRLKAQLFWQLGDMLMKRQGEGDLVTAIRSCEQAVEFEHNSQKGWEQLLALSAQTAKLNPKEVVAYYQKEANGDIRATIYDTLGEAFLLIEDFAKAAQKFRSALARLQDAPDSIRKARLFCALGYALESSDDRENAAIAFRKGAQVKHEKADLRAQLLYNLGQHETPLAAEKCFKEALGLSFQDDALKTKLFCDLGNLYMLHMENTADLEQAIKCYDAAANLGQNHLGIRIRLYEKLANMQCGAQDLKGAEKSFKQCLTLVKNPQIEAWICLQLAKLFVQRDREGDLDQAIECLVRGLNGQHNDSFLEAEMRYILASVFSKRDLEDKLDAIITHLEGAKKITESELPKHKQAHEDLDLRLRVLSSLGQAYLRDQANGQENLTKAIACFQTCLKMQDANGSDIPLLQTMRAGLEQIIPEIQSVL